MTDRPPNGGNRLARDAGFSQNARPFVQNACPFVNSASMPASPIRAPGRVTTACALALWPAAARACDETGAPFEVLGILFLGAEAIPIALALAGWWIKQRFWPARPGVRARPWYFLFAFGAVLTSVILALIGALLYLNGTYLAESAYDLSRTARALLLHGYFLCGVPVLADLLIWATRHSARRTAWAAALFAAECALALGALWLMSSEFLS